MGPTREEAEREYYFLQGEVGRFDQLSHGIKNWGITISFALIAAGLHQGMAELCLVASLASLLFWRTEAHWKRFQLIHIERVKELEEFFVGIDKPYKGPKINKAFVSRLGGWREGMRQEWHIMWLGNVRGSHDCIVALGVLIYALSWFGIILLAADIRSEG